MAEVLERSRDFVSLASWVTRHEFTVRSGGQPVEGVGWQLAASHEVGQVLKRDTGRLAELLVGLPHSGHGTPQPPAHRVFGCRRRVARARHRPVWGLEHRGDHIEKITHLDEGNRCRLRLGRLGFHLAG